MGTTGQPGHRHGTQSCRTAAQATTTHANRWSHTQTTDSSDLTMSIIREICSTCADRAHHIRPPSACHRRHLDSLHRSSDFKTTRQPTEEHLGHVGKIRLPKPEPQPKLLSTPPSLPYRNHCPRNSLLSKPRGEDDANHRGKDAVNHRSLVVAGSKTMPQRRKKT